MVLQGNVLEEKLKISLISNGAKMKMEITELKSQGEQDTPKDFNAMLACSISRAGVLTGLFRVRSERPGEKEPELDDVLKVSDFVLGEKEKVGEREAQVIDYKLTVDNGYAAVENTIWLGTVLLDTETKLPLKRVLSFKNPNESRRVTETYQIQISGKIDGKTFELPK